MSSKYPGGIISKTAPVPSGNYANSTAPGVWTLEQQAAYAKLGQWPTAGNVDPSAFIENLFSTYLYTGTGVARTITNSIDLSGNGGAVWIKGRNAAEPHVLVDTARGASNALRPNSTAASINDAGRVSAFTTSGFTVGTDGETNGSGTTFASWTFRKQPKFFDVVTFTTNESPNPNTGNISHNLGSTPGCVMVKSTSGAQDWKVYHIGTEGGGFFAINRVLQLNDTTAAQTSTNWINVSSTTISFPGGALDSGITYVAYLFAHNAGGFGLTGTDNVISCGSFTAGTGSINLGYEPQWIMFKGSTGAGEWIIFDTMRGWPTEAPNKLLMAQSSAAEGDTYVNCQPTATGFNYSFSPSCIYIAIRRGPMKVPTSGTSVYNAISRTGTGSATSVTGVGFPPSLMISHSRDVGTNNVASNDRLRGASQTVNTNTTGAEFTSSALLSLDQDGFSVSSVASGPYNSSGQTNVNWFFQRAPSFFDEVCYLGTGSVGNAISHNLGVAPELAIFKGRAGTVGSSNWSVFTQFASTNYVRAFLQLTDVGTTFLYTNNAGIAAAPTSTTITVDNVANLNNGATTYVAYLFATCAGVSKVGSYTGTATTLQIDCGFTAGARFVLIKRTDSTGDWYVWDSARGIIAGNDPYLLLNDAAAEVTSTDYIDTYSAGFDITSTAPAAINANGGTFIFLAIA